jgi:TonB family protein
MRRILATSLLFPSLFFPAAVKASTPVDDASAPTPKVRVSTGVIAPQLLGSGHLTIPTSATDAPLYGDVEVGLNLTVDEKGNPQNVKVVKSLDAVWDQRVVDAVRNAHFKPGTIDAEPIPVDLNLTVEITR